MADEEKKKPAIDLRARLGKKTVAGGNPSIPPPMASGGSIPAPPFAAKPAPAEPAKPKYVEPQAIKVEMSEEVVQAQKKGKNKMLALAGLMAVVGMGLGYTLGQGHEKSAGYEKAQKGASMLIDDIDQLTEEVTAMETALKNVRMSLGDGEFPEKAMAELADAAISFDGTYLAGRGIGNMGGNVNQALVKLTGRAEAVNDQKDKVQTWVNGSRARLEEYFKQKTEPKFQWSVYVVPGPHGPMAAMKPIAEPFLIKSKKKMKDPEDKEGKKMIDYKWPEELEYKNPRDPKKSEKFKLYTEGNPVSRTPLLIPVEPSTHAQVCPSDSRSKVLVDQEIGLLGKLLFGDKSDPTNEKPGLGELANNALDLLKKIKQN